MDGNFYEMVFEAGEDGGADVVDRPIIICQGMSAADVQTDRLVCVVLIGTA